ncbi:MAG: translation initiation factor IF-2 [Deltaproteobacteria bacterium]|nr:translation initiation factor IF-2 [Deltaproteobacteria bacterium]
MAKTRVSHLAREFKIGVKDLLQRLKEMNLEVENYLSSIDEPDLERVRSVLSKTAPQVEERRLESGVKRRRRLTSAGLPAPSAEAAPEAEVSEETAKPAAVSTDVSVSDEAQGIAAAEGEKTEPHATKEATPKTRDRKKPTKTTARIIVWSEAEKPAPTPEVSEVKAEPEPAEPSPPEPETAVASSAPEIPSASEASPKTAPAEAVEEKKVTADKGAEAKTTDASAALRRQKAKKAKKEAPARIISLPPAEEIEPQSVSESEVAPKPSYRPKIVEVAKQREKVSVTAEREEKKPKAKKKRGKRGVETVSDEATRKKALRKKEIREGAELYEGVEGDSRFVSKKKGVKKAIRTVSKTALTVPKAIKRRIKVGDSITVGELAKRMGIKSSEIIKKLMGLGVMANINQPIDYDSSVLVASEFGYEVERAFPHEEDIMELRPQGEGNLVPRPPVITIMGHVDHGKTSLLDAIRQSRLIESEAGGITQHIGAYQVSLPHGEVVFLDTPGHEAFTAMRARGAQVTDLVVLIVAADDGVMPQTLEAINHAKAAGVPLVVAINKIDKANANPERVKRELAEQGIVPEDWGGDVQFAEISAKKQLGIDELLEKILLQAELLELKASTDSLARGRIIEAKLDKGRGPVGTVLIQEGTLKTGDVFVCGLQYGRVRAMFDDKGARVEEATPAIPVEVQGFSGVPNAGDEFMVLENERVAKQVAQLRQQKQREAALARISKVTLEKLYERFQEGMVKELNLILKADVQGSIEALTQALSELGTEEIKVNVIHAGTGDIVESDIMLASASNAIVIGFNVRINPKAQALAEQEDVDVRFYDVIYHLSSDIHSALEGMLEPTYEERPLGQAEVRQTFSITKVGTIAGCYVTEGKFERNALIRVRRDHETIFEGKISSLKRFKDDVKEVAAGYECGIGIDKFDDIQVGDILEAYRLEEVKAHLEPMPGRQG